MIFRLQKQNLKGLMLWSIYFSEKKNALVVNFGQNASRQRSQRIPPPQWECSSPLEEMKRRVEDMKANGYVESPEDPSRANMPDDVKQFTLNDLLDQLPNKNVWF